MQEGITIERIINTKIVGVTRKNEDGTSRQELIAECYEGEELFLEREPDNEHDPNAISVWNEYGEQLGYINKDLASKLAPQMDKGMRVACFVTAVTGGDDKSYGCNIKLVLNPEETDNIATKKNTHINSVYSITKEQTPDVKNTVNEKDVKKTKKAKDKKTFSCLGCGCLVFIIIVIIAIINIIF
ncbi:HIRAN domain-containing protein [Anoxybacillus sp. FSL W8-1294]|uniref:HIRAN domain-containing protein n=1 Tax=Anoxybacillus sp. FSL W8-1294 TaxID=2954655 RepID=UPI0030CFFE0D